MLRAWSCLLLLVAFFCEGCGPTIDLTKGLKVTFALAAGSVMSGDDSRATDDLVQETTRVTRIRLDAANGGKVRKPKSPERAA